MNACRLVLVTLLAIAAPALPTSATAAKKIIAADCGVGGCRCLLSSMTLEQVELLTGEPPPAGAEGMTFVMAFGLMQWSPKSPQEIHGYFGGSGSCPIELFPSASYGPRDGVWEFRTTPPDLSNCPAAAMYGVDPPRRERRTIVWGGRFDPNKYMPTATHYVRWSRMDDSNWRGTLGPVGGPMSTTMRARLVDPKTIHGWTDVITAADVARRTRCISAQSDYSAHWISGD